MTQVVNFRVILYGGYPNYFGYHPNFGIISEPVSDANKLGDILLGKGE